MEHLNFDLSILYKNVSFIIAEYRVFVLNVKNDLYNITWYFRM